MPKKKRAPKKDALADDLTALLELDEDTEAPTETTDAMEKLPEETSERPVDTPTPEIAPEEATSPEPTPTEIFPVLPSSYEIEYRTRVRFPVPEILSAAKEIGERVNALENDLASIKEMVKFIQDRISTGFDVTESSSSIFASDEGAEGLRAVTTAGVTPEKPKEEEQEVLDDAFLTLL